MAKKKATRKEVTGRGTRPERKAARRKTAQAGRGPNHPSRTDRAMPGEGKRRQGPRHRA